MTWWHGKAFLTTRDVARVFTEEAQAKADAKAPGGKAPPVKPFDAKMVRNCVYWSRPPKNAADGAADGNRATKSAGRYLDCPIPMPDEDTEGTGQSMTWSPDPPTPEGMNNLVRLIRKWYSVDRPGAGAGGGPKAKKSGKPKGRRSKAGKTGRAG